MENLQALKQEVLDRKIESLELSIKARLLEIENLKENLKRTRDKSEISDIKSDILYHEGYLESTRLELEKMKKTTPEQYIEGCVKKEIDRCNHGIERETVTLQKTQPNSKDIEFATDYVRNEIENLIYDGTLKAPKSPKKQDQFIEDLLQTPEYQTKIQERAQLRVERQRESAQEYLEADKRMLAIVGPDSEEYLKKLIEESKRDSAYSKELICGYDITKIFEMPKSRWGEFSFEDRDVLEVVAQIPPEEYLEKVRPLLINAAEDVLSEYNRDNRAMIAKKVGAALGSVAAPVSAIVSTPFIAMAGTSDAAAIASLAGIAAVWAAGGIGSYKLAKLNEKLDDAHRDIQYEDYIRQEVERVLTEAGYMQKESAESTEQPGQN